MKDNIVTEILRYGRAKKPGREMGFTREELKTHLRNIGFKMDYEDDQTTNIIFDTCFMLNVRETMQHVMKADAYFKLLEYEELEEARTSSRQANVWAIVALSVSIIGTLCSIGFSLKQINTPTEIKQGQIDQITKTLNAQTSQIDSLIKVTQQQSKTKSHVDTVRRK
ncbi:MAG: hypothetical protein C0448_12250 [Sphingobacteriaceae bacterium]|nr:hypothetical protein [Sphingobacteriaceae bacterium]